jgi:hypothetical protein
MVSVDYMTLSRIIQQFLHTGVFRAKVTASRQQAEGYVELHVKEGTILHCFFVNSRGEREKWEEWEKRLVPLGVLNWDHESLQTPEDPFLQVRNPTTPFPQARNPAMPFPQSPIPPGAARSFSPLPYQVVTLSSAQLAQLPSPCRRVYSLIDGRRRMSDIALILQRSEGEISKVVDYLIQLGVVRVRS